MDKRLKIYIALFVLIVIGIVYAESIKQKQISWFPSFSATHKIPYGTYVLRKELKTLFPKKKIKEVYQPPYTFLKDTTHKGTYFFIDNAVNFGEDEFNELLKFVSRGNDVFISTNGVNIDTLHTQTKILRTASYKENPSVRLENPNFNKKEYVFDKDFTKFSFKEVDTLNTTILGNIIVRNSKDSIVKSGANFIKVKYKKGFFYLHTFPFAFTNYNMLLENNDEYVANVLSYLDDEKDILWDAYYKTGKSKITSPMQFVLQSKPLKWAYYVALIGVLFLVIFKAKRKQRAIPVITSLKNQTLAFTRTIANMYYEKSDHKNIIDHKVNLFLDYIRTHHRISTLTINSKFYKKLANRSGNTIENTEKLFKKIEEIQNKTTITKEDLIALNTAIEKFKNIKNL